MSTSSMTANGAKFLHVLRAACVAGSIAAVSLALEIYLTSIAPAHGSIAQFFRSITLIACGTMPAPFHPVAFGVAAHLAISIGWAYGYADLASRNAALSRAPWISGTVFGLLVFLGMQSILLSVHQFQTFTPVAFLNGIIMHTLFFGIPIALVTARILPRSS